jgi:flagellar biosynthesis component FlhA
MMMVTAMMVVVMMTMPAMPTMVVMVLVAMEMMAVMSPVHFRRRQPGIFLDGRCRRGIAERERVRALDRGCEREQCANGRKA